VIKDSMGRRRLARSLSGSPATERLVNTIFVVIESELFPGRNDKWNELFELA